MLITRHEWTVVKLIIRQASKVSQVNCPLEVSASLPVYIGSPDTYTTDTYTVDATIDI